MRRSVRSAGMVGWIRASYRRVRYGTPIIVVTGLPRSGTSMTMQMCTADENNPLGYYEFEPVKHLAEDGDTSWLADARGKVVKIISYLVPSLPDHYNYKLIFVQRDLREILDSQNKMLRDRGEPVDRSADERTISMYDAHLKQVMTFISGCDAFALLEISHQDLLRRPAEAAARINAFLNGNLNVDRMAAVVTRSLYRNRR
jgi:hypothetical protein